MEKTLAIHLAEQREQIAREIETKLGIDAAEIVRGTK
jgi:Trp operon repressor